MTKTLVEFAISSGVLGFALTALLGLLNHDRIHNWLRKPIEGLDAVGDRYLGEKATHELEKKAADVLRDVAEVVDEIQKDDAAKIAIVEKSVVLKAANEALGENKQ
jgi:hypothetical protein